MLERIWRYQIALTAILLTATVAAQELRGDWPAHWEYRQMQRQGPAIHLQAREQKDGQTLQTLDITAIDTHTAQKPITIASINDLACKLRDAALSTSIEKRIPMQEFSNHRGYFFLASDARFIAAKKNSFKQMIEGVMLHQNYLINFTLLTNDAAGSGAKQIMEALSEMKIAALPNSVRPLPLGER